MQQRTEREPGAARGRISLRIPMTACTVDEPHRAATQLAVVTLSAVGGPAAVASYRHARDVIAHHGDPVMAPWLALTTDGMLLAALVVSEPTRHTPGQPHIRPGPLDTADRT
jgi:hypothetical protein